MFNAKIDYNVPTHAEVARLPTDGASGAKTPTEASDGQFGAGRF